MTYYSELENSIGDTKTLLDVGCGVNSPIGYFKNRVSYTLGIDGFEPSIEKSRSKGFHDEYRCMDLLDIDQYFGQDEFECVLASDVIEHFPKDDGNLLLTKMEKVASKRVIVFTPNGFLPQGEHGGNCLQTHQSGWAVREMQDLGYDVVGINGWKPILGEMALPKLRPHKLWTVVSRISQPFVRNHPEYAFQILCVKDVTSS